MIYLLASTLTCFVFLLLSPTKLEPDRNLTGSLIVSVAFGWLIWPVVILGWILTIKMGRGPRIHRLRRSWEPIGR
ncbi:MAG: hypothetical protein ACLP00_18425 [Terracidiphilus sp.]